nr:hypothetical protein GCM10020241_67050 [Streptoalloteichus tenebrarius]
MEAEHIHNLTPVRHPSTDGTDMEWLSMILFGHSAFQYLNAACELGLIDLLARGEPMTAQRIGESLGLAERARDILLLGCTSLGLLRRDRETYCLAPRVADLVERGIWPHVQNVVAFEQHIVYEGQADFTESLRRNTNVGLRRIPGEGNDLYRRLSQTPHLSETFYRYMNSWSRLANGHLARCLDLSEGPARCSTAGAATRSTRSPSRTPTPISTSPFWRCPPT